MPIDEVKDDAGRGFGDVGEPGPVVDQRHDLAEDFVDRRPMRTVPVVLLERLPHPSGAAITVAQDNVADERRAT
ncbi:MAG: hypothetical protein ABIQ18_45125 [Umezawaea sp.]